MTPAPAPLLFQPILLEKVWGGDRLRRFGKPVAEGARIGESWELADMRTTSVSGAGGGAVCSAVRSGPIAGRTLAEVAGLWGVKLGALGPDGAFPLLVKFLDARENLSVQVHPSPAYAAAHPESHLKTECWYVLHAEPGAVIYKGVKAGVTREAFAAALTKGDGAGVVAMLEAVPAVAGECHTLPSGTVHALGAGVVAAEVQTPSDTTFRVYDWGRAGRELHVAPALECIDFGPAPRARRASPAGATMVAETPFFRVEALRLSDDDDWSIGLHKGAAVLMVLDGSAALGSSAGKFAPLTLKKGDTCLVPASVAEGAELTSITIAGFSALLVKLPAP